MNSLSISIFRPILLVSFLAAAACSSIPTISNESLPARTEPPKPDASTSPPADPKDGGEPVLLPNDPIPDAGVPTGPKTTEVVLESLRLEPPTAVVTLTVPGQSATSEFRLLAKLKGVADEQDVTEFSVFSLTNNYELGSFPEFKNVFETNSQVPRGGTAEVQATATGSDGVPVTVTATVQVELAALMPDPRDHSAAPQHAAPANVSQVFDSARAAVPGAVPNLAPELIYPNSGTLLPPNLGRLELQFTAGSATNTLYEVVLASASGSVTYQLRCGVPVADGCLFELDGEGYRYLAESSRGEQVEIRVSATDDAGSYLVTGEPKSISFAKTDVNGALYYWTTSEGTALMRFDFGSAQIDPEVFINRMNTADTDSNGEGDCVGCHALSRDGTKLVASLNGQRGGQQVLVTDLSKPRTDPSFFAKNGDAENRLQFASFDPTGNRFVGVYGDTSEETVRNTLWFHDGDTGERQPADSIPLPWEPDHPDWSPDGKTIAMTRVGIHNTSQRPGNCGIEVLRANTTSWDPPETVIPRAPGKSRYNPSFVPDSSFFVYSESTCAAGKDQGKECDADADPSATTWAAPPTTGATPVWLARAGSPGVRDLGGSELGDTFARVSPFEGTYSGGRIGWVTVSSRRSLGLRPRNDEQQLLWMFAVDLDKILAGTDGSFPAFFLPFQDLETNNHIGQWTTKIVSDKPPPKPPPPSPPPSPPTPPPPRLK